MKFIEKWAPILSATLFLLSACENTNNGLGNSLLEPQAYSTYIDSCSVALITLKADSVASSGHNLLITGRINELYMGETSATSYLSFNLPTFSEHRKFETTRLTMDSLTFELYYDQDFTGDTTKNMTISLHQLNNALQLPSHGNYYTHHYSTFSPDPIVTKTFTPYPSRGHAVSIRMPDFMGQELLELLSQQNTVLSSQETFDNYLGGLALSMPEANNNAALYNYLLNDSSGTLNIYYHFVEDQKESHQIVIKPNTTTSYFSLNQDLSASPFAQLKTGYNGINAVETNNEAMCAGLTGAMIRIEFPYLRNLLELGKTGYVDYAQLILRPINNSYSENFKLPENLELYVVDGTNTATDAITTNSGTEMQTGSLNVDYEFATNTYYSFEITDFINTELKAIGINKRSLLLSLPEDTWSKTAKRVVLGNSLHNTNPVELIIRYNIYE